MLQRDTQDNCRDCRGSGQKLGFGSMFKRCARCQGTGKYIEDDPGRCVHCDGTGRKGYVKEEPKKIEAILAVDPATIPIEVIIPVAAPIKPVEQFKKKIPILKPITNKSSKGKGRRK